MPGQKKPTPYELQDDPYIRGEIYNDPSIPCENCHREALCTRIDEVTLPEGLKPSISMIAFKPNTEDNPVRRVHYLGITCGCYAKFHRQLTHIVDKRRQVAVRKEDLAPQKEPK